MELRPKIVKLAKMVGGLTGVINKIDENAPEYYSLECVVSDEQADVALTLGLRKERTAKYVAKKLGKDEAYCKQKLDELAMIGVCKSYLNEEKEMVYFVQIFAPGILEMMVNNTEQTAKFPQIAKAFEEYTRVRIASLAPNLPMGQAMMRVIPIERAIEGNSKSESYERVSHYLDKYEDFSVTACSCRRSRRYLGEGCGHLEDDMCVQVGTGAEYFINTGRARRVTREEAKEIIRKAEDSGLMHQMPSIEGAGETGAICNCCSCSCFAMRVATMFGNYDSVRSNYVSTVNREKCVACGQCVENCPTNAMKLGQKVCKSEDRIRDYKKSSNSIWSQKDWNVDYRTNKENVTPLGTSPCKTVCPAHISVQGYIKLASQKRYKEALELIKKENPLPAVCGRICPHNCESECTRNSIDNAVAIDEIKKFIADKELHEEHRFIPEIIKKYDKKIAVIGSGPSGISAAYYLAVEGYKVTVFEKESKLGGMLTLGIPSFRLEKDVVNSEIEILKDLGVEFKVNTEIGKDITIQQLRDDNYEAFYLAIGAQKALKLNIPNEDKQGVYSGINFLKDINLGNKTNVTGNVVVIGGGNVAIDVARSATRLETNKVTLVSLEQYDKMPALEEEKEEARHEHVEFLSGYGVKEIIEENGHIKELVLKKCLSTHDSDKRFNPSYDENDTITVKCDSLLLSIGQAIDYGQLDIDGINAKPNKTIIVDELTYQTSIKDIFAGGDVVTGPKFAIDAISAGKQAAITIHRFVQPGQNLLFGRDRRIYNSLDKSDLAELNYDNAQRQLVKVNLKPTLFKDPRQTFTEEQMLKETERCLGCGAVTIDQYKCIGCGQCFIKCKFDAIKLDKVTDTYAPIFEKLPIEVAKHVVKRSGKIAKHAITGK